ncbi:MAG: DUF6713 family protein [Chloroflexota bacterium]
MNIPLDLIFLTGLCFLIIGHELDAIQNHEWRFFFAKIRIADRTAYQIFTALHVPLAIWIIWIWQNPAFQFWADIFLIAHGVVHWLLRNHPKIKFNNWFSRFWIFGGAILGLIHLIAVYL